MPPPLVTSFHAVLFCRNWEESVAFYRDVLELPVLEERAGFVEFKVTPESRIGLMDTRRAPAGAPPAERALLSFRVPDARQTRRRLAGRCPDLPAVRAHPWGAWVLEIADPEGRRLEFWSPRETSREKRPPEGRASGEGDGGGAPAEKLAPADRAPLLEGGIPASELARGLSPEQVRAIMDQGIRKRCGPRHILFRQGDPAARTFYVQSGRLKLTRLNERGDEVIVRYIGPGELTAAVAVFSETQYPVTAQAVSESEIVSWDRRTLLAFMQETPVLATSVLRIVLKHLNELQTRFFELSTEQVEQRLARSVLRFMQHAGRRTQAGIRIDMPLTRQDLAEYTGTTLFTASRTLKGWERRGWIRSGRGRITVTDPHALVLFADRGDARRA